MAVGMVVQQSLIEPDDPARAERLAKRRFGFRFALQADDPGTLVRQASTASSGGWPPWKRASTR